MLPMLSMLSMLPMAVHLGDAKPGQRVGAEPPRADDGVRHHATLDGHHGAGPSQERHRTGPVAVDTHRGHPAHGQGYEHPGDDGHAGRVPPAPRSDDCRGHADGDHEHDRDGDHGKGQSPAPRKPQSGEGTDPGRKPQQQGPQVPRRAPDVGSGLRGNPHQSVTNGAILASVASPMPDTSSNCSTDVNAPFSVRYSTIACAVTGPTPGSSSSSVWEPLLMFTIGGAPADPDVGADAAEAATPGGVATPTRICSPSVSTRARFSERRWTPWRGPPAACRASTTREPAGRVAMPGRRTLPATSTTMRAVGATPAGWGSPPRAPRRPPGAPPGGPPRPARGPAR